MTQFSDTQVADWIAHQTYVGADRLATVDLASDRRFSYGQMNDRVGALAAYMKAEGIQPGDRVGFLAFNSTDILDIIFATWRIGAISLALNFRLTSNELAYIVNDAGARMIFFDTALNKTVEGLKPLVPVSRYVALDGLGGDTEFEKIIRTTVPLYERVPQVLSDQCMLMYSSGTTGNPKGVIFTHGMVLYALLNGLPASQMTAGSVSLAMMPLFHVGGLNVTCLPFLWLGGVTAVVRNFDPVQALDFIGGRELGVTHTLGVPAMFNAMRMAPNIDTTDFSNMVCALAGGASVPQELVEWWYKRGLVIQDGYGMTESAASNCMTPRDYVPTKIGTSGKSLIFTEMKIMSASGEELPDGEVGEIWMRGPTITPGYWNNDKANADSFHDGWFKSGDLAIKDENGCFIIQDRSKDMYISGGENVYPAEVEGILFRHEAVQDVAVIGLPDEKWGEVGCAVVVLKPGATITVDDLRSHCDGLIAKYKWPASMATMDVLPRNATGKVKKFELREIVPKLMS